MPDQHVASIGPRVRVPNDQAAKAFASGHMQELS